MGARPTRMAGTAGTPLPVNDASFEQDGTLGDIWDVVDGVMLGTDSPSAEVAIDDRVALDGSRSVRFNATHRTRLFPEVVQHVPVQAGTPIRARAEGMEIGLSTSILTGTGVERCVAGEKATIRLEAKDYGGNPIHRGGAPLMLEARVPG